LLRHGGRPLFDFGWQYALLTLFIQELWFRLLRLGPIALISPSLACSLAVAIVLAAIADATTAGAGHLLIALCVPFVVAYATDPPHVIEPLFLSLGLLAQIRGRRDHALALAAAAVFIKPSMAYLYGGFCSCRSWRIFPALGN
jgi:hypothetical protein